MRVLAITAATAALLVPAGGAMARVADESTPQAVVSTDLRSPDAIDAATPAPAVDLRSPDAVDAAVPQPALSSVPPPPVPSPRTTVHVTAESGFDWGDAAIGAATMLGLGLIAAGAFALTGSIRRQRQVA